MENNGKIGVKNIARLAKVSIGTVDRVLHNRRGVSATTRKIVEDIIKKTGYQKNIVASRLASKKVIKIVTLLPQGSDRFDYWKLHDEGLSRCEAQLNDLSLELRNYKFQLSNLLNFNEQWQIIKSTQFDALITVPFYQSKTKEIVDSCKTNNQVLIFVDTKSEIFQDISFIGQNPVEAGMVAARLMSHITPVQCNLLVVNISTGAKVHSDNQRELGFREFFIGKSLDTQIYAMNHNLEDIDDFTQEIRKFIDEKGNLNGIFLTNSRSFFAVEAINQLEAENIKIIGFDLNKRNIEYLENEKIQFLINQNPDLQSEKAVNAAFRSIAYGINDNLSSTISVEIIVKENIEDKG